MASASHADVTSAPPPTGARLSRGLQGSALLAGGLEGPPCTCGQSTLPFPALGISIPQLKFTPSWALRLHSPDTRGQSSGSLQHRPSAASEDTQADSGHVGDPYRPRCGSPGADGPTDPERQKEPVSSLCRDTEVGRTKGSPTSVSQGGTAVGAGGGCQEAGLPAAVRHPAGGRVPESRLSQSQPEKGPWQTVVSAWRVSSREIPAQPRGLGCSRDMDPVSTTLAERGCRRLAALSLPSCPESP